MRIAFCKDHVVTVEGDEEQLVNLYEEASERRGFFEIKLGNMMIIHRNGVEVSMFWDMDLYSSNKKGCESSRTLW